MNIYPGDEAMPFYEMDESDGCGWITVAVLFFIGVVAVSIWRAF
jgi:hypothetical protein